MSATSVTSCGRLRFAVKKNAWRNQMMPAGKENSAIKRNASKNEGGSSPPKQRTSSVLSPVAADNAAADASIKLSPVRKLLPLPPDDQDHLPPALESGAIAVRVPSDNESFDENCSLSGRNDKVIELTSFVLAHLEAGTSASAYVSGPPGTGKTATLRAIMSNPKVSRGYRIVYINCTGMRSSGAVFAEIAKRVGVCPARSEKSNLATIEKYLVSSHKMILLVLDEMDQLESRNQGVLYTVFGWASRGADTRLVLIGVANALDLTDRLLPRIRSRGGVQPTLVHFPPYTRDQIVDIVQSTIFSQGNKNSSGVTFGQGALELLASKVASVSGDARRAINVARRTIDTTLMNRQPGDAVVNVQDVLGVLNSAYATSQTLVTTVANNSNSDAVTPTVESCFPLQQRLLICSLLLIKRSSPKSKDITVGLLHETYRRVCEKRNLSALDLSEFVSLAELVESRGVMKIVGKTRNRLSKVMMQWDEKEVSSALQDKQLLADIINDVSCLPK